MYNQHYEEIGTPDSFTKIDILPYVRAFLLQLSKLEQEEVKINDEMEASRIKDLMNLSKNTTFKSLNDLQSGRPY